jgi:hypothetical protein
MAQGPRIGRRRIRALVVLSVPLTVAALLVAGVAMGADAKKPSMEVLPRATGLKYSQTVTIKAHHLPKGSGSVAATICGLQDSKGKALKEPTAKDCAGAPELGKLVVLKSWQSNGEFETKYTLPKSGQKFGENKRFCDKTHHCALVVADANPDDPAYHVDTVIQFVDQQPFGATPTTKPKPKPKPKPSGSNTGGTNNGTRSGSGSHTEPGVTSDDAVDADMNPDHPHLRIEGTLGVHPRAGGAPASPGAPESGSDPVPPEMKEALQQVCTQLIEAVKQAGGDPSGLSAACAALSSGGGPQQLAAVLQAPSLLCVQAASAWQNNAQVTDACNQAAAAIAPVTGPLGAAAGPALG